MSTSAQQKSAQEKFQDLLRELFQFDCADLDFGIYRIMNHKRAVVERFINEDLPKAIAEQLHKGALAEQQQAQQALEAARQKVLDALGDDALDADGNLAQKYRRTKAGKEYLEAQAKAVGTRATEALETEVYNHLYTFFSRYWQDGDFISKRRYSKKHRYAIPYNGEEVYLYWANHDQYYIKTGEYFTDYSFKAPNGVTVQFKLQRADVEQNNVKGEKRYFFPVEEGIGWDGQARVLTIPFHFVPLSSRAGRYVARAELKPEKNQQEKIIEAAISEIPHIVANKYADAPDALAALTAERRRKEDGTVVSYFEHHLRQYTRRNTSDFFIHKDLKGFLSRELDFYLKSEVLNLEEMEAAGERLAEGWFQLMRLVKRVGLQIIEFLAQIEDFQKMLWEKKKFITETFYVITVGNIGEQFYPEIAACDAQWQQWKKLLHIDEDQNDNALFMAGKGSKDKRVEFLKGHPSLPLDTSRFPAEFTDRLLASFENLDEMTDGLLIHSENWQALNLLQEKYRQRVKCIYIDPPYNTGNDEFLYRDQYQHSSWLAMMTDRLSCAQYCISKDGAFVTSLDDGECDRARLTLQEILGPQSFVERIVWRKRSTPPNDKILGAQHEYALVFSASDQRDSLNLKPRSEEQVKRYKNPDNHPKGPWVPGDLLANVKGGRYVESLYFPIVNPRTGEKFYPPTGGNWRFNKETIEQLLANNEIWFGQDDRQRPKLKRFLSDVKPGVTWSTLWWSVALNTEGSREMVAFFGNMLAFENPKPTCYLEHILLLGCRPNTYVLDYFAGSGTTGHAVINLNREDGGRRKFILVEMAHYFDTVLLPRIKKVTYSPEWKDGKPKRQATAEEAQRGPRIIKVIRLESYEDALNNLTFDEEGGQKALELFKDDYLLRYMLRWETRKSETLLDVEKLETPFEYQLLLHRDGQTQQRSVDLPETFNYLLGLDVATRKTYDDRGRRYVVYRGTLRDGRTAVVIWRDIKNWTDKDYQRDRDFVAKHKLAHGADEVFVNGDSLIGGARSLDGVFKERMFAPVEA